VWGVGCIGGVLRYGASGACCDVMQATEFPNMPKPPVNQPLPPIKAHSFNIAQVLLGGLIASLQLM